MTVQVGKCALCLKVGPLCKSHAIPKFMFKRLRNSDGKFYNVDLATMKRRDGGDGIYERLLCSQCESIMHRYEDYAAGLLYGNKDRNVQEQESVFPDKVPYTLYR